MYKSNETFETVSNIIKKEIKREILYNQKNLKPEDKKSLKEGFYCICQRVIFIDSVYAKTESCYPKMFLEKWYFNKDM